MYVFHCGQKHSDGKNMLKSILTLYVPKVPKIKIQIKSQILFCKILKTNCAMQK